MFEIGKYYTIRMWEDGEGGGVINEYATGRVLEVAPPLVKFEGGEDDEAGEIIINTASLAFVSAVEAEE